MSYSVKDIKSGVYKFENSNNNSLFEKYDLSLIDYKLDKSKAIKISPNVYDDTFYYRVDFTNNIVEVKNNR